MKMLKKAITTTKSIKLMAKVIKVETMLEKG